VSQANPVSFISPARIRCRAAAAFNGRMRLEIDRGPLPMRAPAPGETPLSAEERRFAVARGLIRPLAGEISSVEVAQSLYRMAAGGMAKRYETGRRNVVFGVTRECKVPRGVSLADLMSLGVLKDKA
jgi:hypothetical protein